jgi:hypothetical protein
MKDLYASKYSETPKYLYYYYNISYEPSSTVSLSGTYDTNFEFTAKTSIDGHYTVSELN